MRPALFILPLLVTACATPREACINGANSELRVMNALVAKTRGNLARGYAIREVETTRIVNTTCTRRGALNRLETFSCPETVTDTRSEPEAIDLNAEQAKLTSLEQRQAQMQTNANAPIQQCIATNPE